MVPMDAGGAAGCSRVLLARKVLGRVRNAAIYSLNLLLRWNLQSKLLERD